MEVESAEEALETFRPEHYLDQADSPPKRQDVKEVVKASLIAPLKDPEAAKLISEKNFSS